MHLKEPSIELEMEIRSSYFPFILSKTNEVQDIWGNVFYL